MTSQKTELPKLFFEPVARLQRFLGKELIADPNVAVIEFIKNSYDAEASEVYVDLKLTPASKTIHEITISDNGTGMDLESFRENWMKPGFSYKAEARGDSGGRIPVGEKGLGRLSAGRLGDRLHIYTRTNQEAPWLHVFIDWNSFETMHTPLNQIPVDYDEVEEPKEPRIQSGTIICIENLSVDWSGKLPGRKAQGRSEYRLGRLREDISILLQPIPQGQRDFSIHLFSDSTDLEQFDGWVSPNEPEFVDYQFDVTVTSDKGNYKIQRSITRSSEIAQMAGKPIFDSVEYSSHEKEDEALPVDLLCGPFSAVFYYSPPSIKRSRQLGITPGVFVYRDGVRVEPYGQQGNDWLGATAWKAARQGQAPIQPNNLSGYFVISRFQNQELKDMANRQGLVDNDAFQAFSAIAEHEFRWFADLIYEEYVEPSWESLQEKAQRSAQRTQAFGVAIIRALVHSIRAPTSALGTEMDTLHHLVNQFQVDPELKSQLESLEKRSVGHIETIEATIQRFLQFDQEQLTAEATFKDFLISDLIFEAVGLTRSLAETNGVEVEVAQIPRLKPTFNKEVLLIGVQELITNAIEASAGANPRNGKVMIRAQGSQGKEYEIIVSDNGPGIDPKDRTRIFIGSGDSKGRPSVGLMLLRETLTLFGATISLSRSSEAGSEFSLAFVDPD